MPKQFLNGAQIAARCQKVGGEAMAQSMRRGGCGQAHLCAGFFHDQSDQACIQWATFCAAKKRIVC